MCKTILSSQHATTVKTSKEGKNQKSTDKHSSFDGLIQEDIDLSDIYLAVHIIIFQMLRSTNEKKTYYARE